MSRPHRLRGSTYEIRNPADAHSIFITINNIEKTNGFAPYEVFIQSCDAAHVQWVAGLSNLLSAMLQEGVDIKGVLNTMEGIEDPKNGCYFTKGTKIPSNVAHISTIILKHINELNKEHTD